MGHAMAAPKHARVSRRGTTSSSIAIAAPAAGTVSQHHSGGLPALCVCWDERARVAGTPLKHTHTHTHALRTMQHAM
eukprot:SAG11_NODE_333_length_10574_cov_7.889451_1_plen_77_part_00